MQTGTEKEGTSAADATTGAVGIGLLIIDVTASLTAWIADPATNLGWALLPTGSNGLDYFSAEGATPPRLVVEYTAPSPLMADTSAIASGSAQPLTGEQLTAIVETAIERLTLSAGSEATNALKDTAFEIVDLPANLLGQATANTIQIDVDAAGYGWFVDTTPSDSLEFTYDKSTRQLVADSRSSAAGYFDLLTVVLHEFGHILGHGHADSEMLTSSVLSLGTRRLPTPQFADYLDGLGDRHSLTDYIFNADTFNDDALEEFFNLLGQTK